MTSSNNKLTNEQKSSIIKKINDDNMTLVGIAKEFGVHPRTIGYWIKKIRKEANKQGLDIKINTHAGRRPTKLNIT